MEEFSKKQIMALNLHQVKIDDSYFKKKEPPQKKAPHPIDVMNRKLELISSLRMPQKLRNLNPMPVLPKLPKQMKDAPLHIKKLFEVKND